MFSLRLQGHMNYDIMCLMYVCLLFLQNSTAMTKFCAESAVTKHRDFIMEFIPAKVAR